METRNLHPNRDDYTHGTAQDRALQNVRRLVQRNRQDSGLPRASAAPRPIESVGIAGAGMMGIAIAAVHVRANLPVVITDADDKALGEAPDRIAGELAEEMPIARARQLVGRLVRPSTDHKAVGRCDLVLESIVERLEAKQRL